MADKPLNPPSKSPIVDKNGIMSIDWLIFFNQLYARVGGATAPTNNDISGDTTALSARLDGFQAEVDIAEANANNAINLVSTLSATVLAQNTAIVGLQTTLSALQSTVTTQGTAITTMQAQLDWLQVMWNDGAFNNI